MKETVNTTPVQPENAGIGNAGVAACTELLNAFLSKRPPGTLRGYSDDLNAYRAWMKHKTLVQTVKWLVSRNSVEAALLAVQFRAFLIRVRQSRSQINRKLSSLRSLIECGRSMGIVAWTLEIRNVKNVNFADTRGAGICGIEALIAAAEKQEHRKAVRDKAIVQLLYTLSLSRVSIASIELEHCDFERSLLRVGGSKMKPEILIPAQTLESLKAWRQVRGEAPGPLFVGMKGIRRLTASGMYRVLRTLAKRAGRVPQPFNRSMEEAGHATCEPLRAVS